MAVTREDALDALTRIRWDLDKYGDQVMGRPFVEKLHGRMKAEMLELPRGASISSDMESNLNLIQRRVDDVTQKIEQDQRAQEERDQIARGEIPDEEELYFPNLRTPDDSREWLESFTKWHPDDPTITEWTPRIQEQLRAGNTAEVEISAMVRAMELHNFDGEGFESLKVIPYHGTYYHGTGSSWEVPEARRPDVEPIFAPPAFYLTSDWPTAIEYTLKGGDDVAQVYEMSVDANRILDCSKCEDELLSYGFLKAYDDGLDGILIPASTNIMRGLDPVPEVVLFRPEETSRIISVHKAPKINKANEDAYYAWLDGVPDEHGRLGPPPKQNKTPDMSMVASAVRNYQDAETREYEPSLAKSMEYRGMASQSSYSQRSGRGRMY